MAGDPESKSIGTEFVGTSISSGGNGEPMNELGEGILKDNTHVLFYNCQRGYTKCTVTSESWKTDFRIIPYVDKQGAKVTTVGSFIIQDGQKVEQA